MYYIFNFKRSAAVFSMVLMCILIVGASAASFTASPAAADDSKLRIPIIMYHGFSESTTRRNQYMISPDCLEEDLKYLKEHGYTTIFLSELTEHFKSGLELPEKPIILTFDDGYYDNYVYAWPLLEKYECKAVISPIGKAADEAENEEYRSVLWSQCTWEELKEMSDSGFVELQNHTYDLHKLNKGWQGAAAKTGESDDDYKQRLSEDLLKSNAQIQEVTGNVPDAVVYPFGAKSDTTEDIVRSLGFSAALDCEEKINYIDSPDDLFQLHRFLRPDNISSADFFGKFEKI
ncbi:MAG: polysaccharide deacetylase family protein [Clostridia bacterium]|nr:polysaccharide deacetylase family protein [Clostridia bacterium]